MKTNKLAKLLGTASVAAFAYAGALSAQEAISDFADYGDTYENIIEQNYDDFDDIEIYSYNDLSSEGALGATNMGLEQVAVSQFVTFAGNTDSAHDTLIDQSHYIDWEADDYELGLGAYNQATAHTTSFDAMLGGSQIAMTSFNTAALDITTSGEDFDAEIALLQSLDSEYQDYDGYSVEFSAVNIMDAATAYAGTATIDSETFNADLNEGEGGYENGVQQAAISINTLSVDSEVDTFIELAGQNIDTDALTSAYDPVGPSSEGDSDFMAINVARAYAPVPATSEYVDPRLANDLNDPSIKNLDQVAAITINSMSFGNAADAEEGIDASTANFDVLSYSNSGGEDAYGPGSTEGQYAEFDNDWDEVTLDNIMVATTMEEVYTTFMDDDAGLDWFAMEDLTEDDGIGQVAIENTSQVTALTINSINNAGDGALTLKETYAYGPEYTSADDSDFDQQLQDLEYQAQIENLAVAVTEVGDASASELVQVAQYSVNSIASGGDLNSWNEDGSDGIDQQVDGFDIFRFDGDGEFGPELALNTVGVSTNFGNAEASNIDQRMQYSVNTVSVGGDMTAGLNQDIDSSYVELDGYVNMIAVGSGGWWDDGADVVSITDAQQVALFSMNTVSVDGVLDTDYTDQHYDDADDFELGDGTLNYATAYNDIGDASVSGLDQIAQLTFNSVSADSLTGDDSDIHQSLEDLYDMQDGAYAMNEIDVEADYRGNAAIDSSSQAFILNANTIRIAGAVTGDLIEQDAEDINLDDFDYGDMATNTAYAWADDDVNGARWVGGNASITGLTQTLAMNFNSISAGSLEGVRIDQYADEIYVNVGNYAYADAELGAAVMTGVSQTTINRINTISITPPSLD